MLIETLGAFVGAIAQELTYWYSVRDRLRARPVANRLRSVGYWVISVIWVATATAGAVLFLHDLAATPREYVVIGAGFAPLLRSAVNAARAAPKELAYGSGLSTVATWVRDYFGPARPRID